MLIIFFCLAALASHTGYKEVITYSKAKLNISFCVNSEKVQPFARETFSFTMFPFFFQHHEKLCKEKKRKNKKRQILQIPARMVRYLQLIYNSCKCLSSPLTLVSWLSSPFLELLLLDHQSLKSIHTKEISTL